MASTRRQLLASAAATVASSLVRAGDPVGRPAAAPAAGDGPGIGVIGLRYQGSVIAAQAKPHGRIVAIADADRDCLDLKIIDKNVKGQTGLETVEVVLGKNKAGGPFATKPVPTNLDWNLWQGQTPGVPYVPERTHYTFRWWQAYSGGQLTDWGAHHVDIARWAIGEEPVEIEGTATYPATPNGYDVPIDFSAGYRFANGVEMTVADHGRNGILFTGSAGRIFVNRENLSGTPVDDLKDRPLPGGSRSPMSRRDTAACRSAISATSPAGLVGSWRGIRRPSDSSPMPKPTRCSRGRSGRVSRSGHDHRMQTPAQRLPPSVRCKRGHDARVARMYLPTLTEYP